MLALQTVSPEANQHWNAAHHAEEQKQFDVAVTEYRKVTELEPAFAAGFVSLGQALMEQRNYWFRLWFRSSMRSRSIRISSLRTNFLATPCWPRATRRKPFLISTRAHEQGALGIAQAETGQFC